MYRFILDAVRWGLSRQVSATGLGAFRIAFALVALQEIVFLFYFRHLIFDPVPYLDRASPVLHVFLLVWMAVVLGLALGYRTRIMAFANYCLWVVFVVFTPMWQDFDGGFDQLMTGTSFLLIFLPSERALSLDRLRWKLRYSVPGRRYDPPAGVPVLAYTLTLGITLGLLYLDSGLHKLSAEFWRNGMGSWLPATMPYYVSPLDMSPLLDLEYVERFIGYTIILFQLGFIFLYWRRPFRVPLLVLGITFHIGIILSLNVYPFGFAMLVQYLLLVPFRWWRWCGRVIRRETPALTVFYDQDCPLCNRMVLVIEHFDIVKAIAFKGLQTHARDYLQLAAMPEETLLRDLYAIDRRGRLHAGLDTYIRILEGMLYTAPVGFVLRLPGVNALARRTYRNIADNRQRLVCGAGCVVTPPAEVEDERPFARLFARYAGTETQQAHRIARFLVLLLLLQLNSTVHYGVLYRWAGTRPADPGLALLDHLSDSVINLSHAFLGISPHALYMHDHFAGYERLLAIVYRDPAGGERWLPFVNPEGRLLTPNWGRVQSMWANVAVTSHMSPDRLEKFLKKVTAFYAPDLGVDLGSAEFGIKLKHVDVPFDWEPGLRQRNQRAPWRDVGTLRWGPDGARLLFADPEAVFGPTPGQRAERDRATPERSLPFPRQ